MEKGETGFTTKWTEIQINSSLGCGVTVGNYLTRAGSTNKTRIYKLHKCVPPNDQRQRTMCAKDEIDRHVYGEVTRITRILWGKK